MSIKLRKYEVTLVGDSGVGKTTVISKLTNRNFPLNSITPTVGIEFSTTTINCGEEQIMLNVHDVSGSSVYKSIIHSHFEGKHAIILAFNLRNLKSFNNLNKWIEQINSHIKSLKPVYLIGIKGKHEDNRSVTIDEINRFKLKKNIRMYKEMDPNNCESLRDEFIDILLDIMDEEALEDVDLESTPSCTDRKTLLSGEMKNSKKCCVIQ